MVLFEAGSGSTQFTYDREATDSLTYVSKITSQTLYPLLMPLLLGKYFDVKGSGVSPDRGGGGGGPSSSQDISGPIGLAMIFL